MIIQNGFAVPLIPPLLAPARAAIIGCSDWFRRGRAGARRARGSHREVLT
jgi:hypothetical protein